MSNLRIATPTEIRDEFWSLVRGDLLGPAGGPEEVLPSQTAPRDRYLVGMLAPSGQEVSPDMLEDLWVEGEDEAQPDLTAGAARGLFPSSLGLSFCLSESESAPIEVEVAWGQYFRDAERQLQSARPERLWRRVPRSVRLKLPPLQSGTWGPVPVSADHPQIVVQGLARKRDKLWVVSLFLVNSQPVPKQNEQQAWMFQVSLTLHGSFSPRRDRLEPGDLQPEVWQESLDHQRLYSHVQEYAVGHGTSAKGDAGFLRTDSLPSSLVAAQSPPTPTEAPALADLVVSMQALSELKNGTFRQALEPLAVAYESWIAGLPERLSSLSTCLLASGQAAVQQTQVALERIRQGIALLDEDSVAAQAFRFANQAMALQRLHTLKAMQARRGLKGDITETPSWRIFQLAFLLMNLPALTQPEHPDRNEVADLLFFPTGGGKTEAYLGLTAYTLAIRRLQPEPDQRSGVAVLMRYTLRLLTLQQFQRAATLICACEMLRRKDPKKWGAEAFRLGLWVGAKTTPNRTEDAAEAVRLLKASKGTQRYGNPLQLTHCPWCGCELGPDQVKVHSYEHGQARTLIHCGDPLGKCPFSERQSPDEGLPVVVVDEEIYRRLPAVLISTIDKFAQMAWNGAVGTLFGRVSGYCPRHGFVAPCIKDDTFHQAKGKLPKVHQEKRGPLRPPDLIIQDELHLISGPLGTLAGLFEVAVEELCCWNLGDARIRPKIIASTATIRRSEQQIARIFDRRVALFPPPGLSIQDNFFSRTRIDLPGRLYLGVCAPGARMKTALIRCYLSLLSSAQTIAERYGDRADAWMTLVGYFNSLRELGGMRRLTEDQVATRLRRMDRWSMSSRALFTERIEELTSRKSAGDIPKILERLETPVLNAKGGIELLLATNMLSVGVDISRLGLLVVAGQPKSTAEYIQATSRVGRSDDGPGVVLTVYNWARPRDLSHYEKFDHYHQTFYRQVEALSVTPFSARAIDRGLTSVLVSLIRLWSLAFNDNDKAFSLSLKDPIVSEVLEAIQRRSLGQISPDLVQQRLEDWMDRIDKHRATKTRLGYRDQNDGITVGLLLRPEDADWELWTVLESLRDVEPPANLVLLESQGV